MEQEQSSVTQRLSAVKLTTLDFNALNLWSRCDRYSTPQPHMLLVFSFRPY